ncbi:MAG TPA: patatin-like protein [Trueperaceae bacterium]|nr:patatin-like protein [Trueperaceae bacterium]
MPSSSVEHEVRLAVVMYGGVSLAIYMNGVARELLEFVRATSDADPAAAESLSGTARVYRKLARALEARDREAGGRDEPGDAAPLTVRFLVDIISGTSAGGINAAMLAKALVRNADLDPLKRLWVDNGGLEKLVNDRSNEATRALYREPVRALFNSDYMYLELLAAMTALNASAGAPLVDELSLAITGTDLAGRPIALRLEDRVAREYAHRHTFDFRYSRHERDDFTPVQDPLLAFAARTTSSMPAAFEPTIASRARALAGRAGKAADWGLLFRDVPAHARDGYVTEHAFADGGYLDNKPFGHAIDRLAEAEGGVQVTRKLFYLEPLPQRIDPRAHPGHAPNALENTLDVFTLARYETIRADLRRIEERNRLARRLRTLHAGVVEDGLCDREPCDAAPREGAPFRDLDDLTERCGPGYGGYHRLRVAATTDAMAGAVADALQVPADSDLRAAMRQVAAAWRGERFYRNHGDPERRETAFLARYDLAFHRRRAVFMAAKINQLLELEPQVVAELRNLVARAGYPTIAGVIELYDAGRPGDADAAWDAARSELRVAKVLARRAAYALRHGEGDDRLLAALPTVTEGNDDRLASALLPLLAARTDAARATATRQFLQKHGERVQALADALAARCRERVATAADAFADIDTLVVEGALQQEVRGLLRCYWRQFASFDVVQFPVLNATGFGEELSPVGVHRISATDPGFYGTAFARADKLEGARFAHFGAFLDARWRRHDIRWGRLDAAERLISSLLGDDSAVERDTLIAEAHLAILHQELPAEQAAIDELVSDLAGPGGPSDLTVGRARAALERLLAKHERDLDLNARTLASDLSRLLRVTGKLLRTLVGESDLHGLVAVAARSAAWLVTQLLALTAALARLGLLPVSTRKEGKR